MISLLFNIKTCFQDIQDSCEPSIFSFERLLFNIINDTRSHIDILKQVGINDAVIVRQLKIKIDNYIFCHYKLLST